MAVDSFARDLASAALSQNSSGSNYAKLNSNNIFNGNQTINGEVVINGRVLENNIRTEIPVGDFQVNLEYYLGEQSSLDISLPEGELGQYIFISFASGDEPTDLSFSTNNWIGDVPIPETNRTYEMICTWNGEAWVFSYRGY